MKRKRFSYWIIFCNFDTEEVREFYDVQYISKRMAKSSIHRRMKNRGILNGNNFYWIWVFDNKEEFDSFSIENWHFGIPEEKLDDFLKLADWVDKDIDKRLKQYERCCLNND